MAPKFNIKFRPSKAPGFMQCASYCLEPERPYKLVESDKEMEFATLGTACHEVFSDLIVKKIKVTEENLMEIAEKYNVPYEGYMGLARKGFLMERKWIENLARFFTNPVSEEKISFPLPNGEVNEGTPDLYQLNGDYALLLDLKSGETDLDYTAQLMTYALILYRIHEATGLNTFYLYLWAPVIDSYFGIQVNGSDLEAFEKQIVEKWEKVGKEYKTGPWCSYCDTIEVCPQHRRAFLKMEDQVKEITVEQIAEARPIIKAMQKIVELYEKTEKALLEKYGTIDLGDGHELFYNTIMRDTLDVPKTIQVLSDDFNIPLNTIGPHLKLTKAAVNEIGGDAAPARQKTKFRKQIIETLKEKGAVTEAITKKRQVRRINKQLEEE